MALPRGIRNNNPLNIRKGNNWQGERPRQTDPAFEEFQSMEMGIRAGFKILRNYMRPVREGYRDGLSIAAIITRWAPPAENKTDRYIDCVAKFSGIDKYERLNFEDKAKMVSLVDAMIRVECGQPVSREIIESAYDLV